MSAQPRRSPSYPAINLETAIQRARALYEQEHQHAASVDTIVRHWGYKSLNGPASLSLAALKKFGLIEDEGSGSARTARLTDLAVEVLANPNLVLRKQAIQRAALNPAIHKELWDKYGAEPPSDANLEWELTRNRGFTSTGAAEFVPEYRETIAFAELRSGGTVAPQEDSEDDNEAPPETPAEQKRKRRRMSEASRVLTIPLLSGAAIELEGEFPITEPDWAQFLAVLTAMKPGLVIGAQPTSEQIDEALAGVFLPDPSNED